MECDGKGIGSDMGGSSAAAAAVEGRTCSTPPELAALCRCGGDSWKRRFVRAMNDIALRQASSTTAAAFAAHEDDTVESFSVGKSVSRWELQLQQLAVHTGTS
jgi:hypothetical protein